MNDTELKPCPFCGNKGLIEDVQEYDNQMTYWIECDKCEIVMERQTKCLAYQDWNTRTP